MMEYKNTEKQKNSYFQNVYDDGNIPNVDLPQDHTENCGKAQNRTENCSKNLHTDYESVEPLPESSRPRKDGPGGGEE